ncbi:MAG TPA: L,D-transpeptidase family protein [Vicinamibacterales bacterium]|nr:L,D-transpeptidase family protein [Vicinamibacterales bacterium]
MGRSRSIGPLVPTLLALAAGAGLLGAADSGIVVSPSVVGDSRLYIVQRGDTLASLGARYGITPRTLARSNGLPVDGRLRPGALLALDNLHIVPLRPDRAIVVNVPQRMLFVTTGDGLARGYPVAVGRADWQTPRGDFTIVAREEQPTWDVPRSIQQEMRRQGKRVITKMPPCPENPLGEYWLGLSLPALGIHGTSAPLSIHRTVTHGCIRLHPDDIRAVFSLVRVGQPGSIVYEPTLLADVRGRIYLEAHPDVYRLQSGVSAAVVRAAERGKFAGCIDWSLARDVLAKREGVARMIGFCAPATGGLP